MGLLDSIKSSCTKIATKAFGEHSKKQKGKGGGGGKSSSRAPEDADAYAEKVSEAIRADVR